MKIIKNVKTDEERAFYAINSAHFIDCSFAGDRDGESALKESKNIIAENCDFLLRYPLWHTENFKIKNSFFDITTRAPVWYSSCGEFSNCKISGVKFLRECKNVVFSNCRAVSPEFGWKCDGITLENCSLESEYAFFMSKNIKAAGLEFSGKYSFQYVQNAVLEDCDLNTKDAFWHGENITVKNCTIKGEYLGWYSKNLKFINCKIIGTQPLCYCENLVLENCTMEDTDLSFEYSSVNAEIVGNIMSVKNPKSGKISAGSIDEIILENSVIKTDCEIVTEK